MTPPLGEAASSVAYCSAVKELSFSIEELAADLSNERARRSNGSISISATSKPLWSNLEASVASAVPGSFALTPHDGMLADLRRDYKAMSGMVFGPIPTVDAVVAAIVELEQRINRRH